MRYVGLGWLQAVQIEGTTTSVAGPLRWPGTMKAGWLFGKVLSKRVETGAKLMLHTSAMVGAMLGGSEPNNRSQPQNPHYGSLLYIWSHRAVSKTMGQRSFKPPV